MGGNMEKDLRNLALYTGLAYNEQTDTLSGTERGYNIAIKEDADNNCYTFYCWVKPGEASLPENLQNFVNGYKTKAENNVIDWRYSDNTMLAVIAKSENSEQNGKSLKAFAEDITMFYSMNGYESCCAFCSSEDGLGIYDDGTAVFQLCTKCMHAKKAGAANTQPAMSAAHQHASCQESHTFGQQNQNFGQQNQNFGQPTPPPVPQSNPQQANYDFGYNTSGHNLVFEAVKPLKNNVALGFLGALLFSIIGGVIWLFISQMGYISYLGGLAMSFLVIFGYKKFSGGGFNAVSVFICVVVIAGMILLAETSSMVLYIMKGINNIYGSGIGFFESWAWLPVWMSDSEISGAFVRDLVIGYIITAITSVILFVGEFKNSR